MSTSPTLRDLQKKYKEKLAEYDAKVANALDTNDVSALTDIRKLNEDISKLLEQMLDGTVGDPQSIRSQREELVQTLGRIESDYTGMAKSTDALERLRMIRRNETGVARQTFNWYLFLFVLTCMGILFMTLFSPQNIVATAMSPAIPASTAPFV